MRFSVKTDTQGMSSICIFVMIAASTGHAYPLARGKAGLRRDHPRGDPGRASARLLEGLRRRGVEPGPSSRRAEGIGRWLLRRLGVSPFTVGRSPSARRKGASRAERDRSEAETLAPGATVTGR